MTPDVSSPRGFLALALAAALTVLLVGLVAPALALPPLLSFAIAYLAVTTEIVLLAAFVPRLSVRVTVAVCVGCLLVLLALAQAPATAPFAAALTLVLGPGATLLGAQVGARIEKPGQLAAVALVSAVADLWSVFDPSAPSARFAEDVLAHPDRLAVFALPFPLFGSDVVPAVIGAGDVVFAALYVSGFRAHGLPVRRVLLALSLAFVLGLVGLLITLRPLPLLPLLGVAVMVSDPAARSLSRREWRTVILVLAALLLAIGLRVLR